MNDDIDGIICGNCGVDLPDEHKTKCPGKPELLEGTPIGMYHCEYCCAMVLAGYPHTPVCDPCIEKLLP